MLDWATVRGFREGDNPARWAGHLAHLLPPASIEKPWFLEIFKNIKELISPPKLPPLEITSKPVPITEIKIYAGNEAKSGFL